MRAKLSCGSREDAGVVGTTQFSVCNGGSAASIFAVIPATTFLPNDGCVVDHRAAIRAPSRAATDALVGPDAAAENFGDSNIMLGSLELNYDLSDNLTLTSVTGLYDAERQ